MHVESPQGRPSSSHSRQRVVHFDDNEVGRRRSLSVGSIGSALRQGVIHLNSPLVRRTSREFGVLLRDGVKAAGEETTTHDTEQSIENKKSRRDKSKYFVLSCWGIMTVVSWVTSTVTRRMVGLSFERFPLFLAWSSAVATVPLLFILYGTAELIRKVRRQKLSSVRSSSDSTDDLEALPVVEPHENPFSQPTEIEIESFRRSDHELQHVTLLQAPPITPSVKPMPQKWLILFGFLTAVANYLMLFASGQVPGELQTLLGPTIATIPLSMLASALILKWRPHALHGLAALLIISGVVIVILPSMLGDSPQKEDYSSPTSVAWDFVFLSSTIPLAVMSVLEERSFQKFDIDAFKMTAFEALYACIFTLALMPLALIPSFGPTTAESFLTDNANAFQCFFNMLSQEDNATIDVGGESVNVSSLYCETAWIPWTLYTVGFGVSILAQIATTQYGSAVFAFICIAVSAPLSEFVFAIPGVETEQGDVLQWYNYISVLLLCVGIISYIMGDRQKRRKARRRKKQRVHIEDPVKSTKSIELYPQSNEDKALSY